MSEETPARPTNLVDLLDQLIEPAPPPPVSMAPQTAGWAVLALLVLCGLVYALWTYRDYRQRNAYRRAALVALDGAGDDASAIAAVLRRAALVAYPRSEVASLSGDDWLSFLDRSGRMSGFREGAGRVLVTAPYAGVGKPAPELSGLARTWITKHEGGQGA